MPPQDTLADAPFFVDHLLRQVEETTGAPLPDGVRAYTTLDPVLQRLATQPLESDLGKLEAAYPALTGHSSPVQAALVALDPATGGILAMVGSRDYRTSQYNRAVQSKRQPGSLFKPLVYLAALEARRELSGGQPITAATSIVDEPVTFESGAGVWAPQNYDHRFHGTVSVRTAIEQSLNIPAVKIAQAVGTKRILQICGSLGVAGRDDSGRGSRLASYARPASSGVPASGLCHDLVAQGCGRARHRGQGEGDGSAWECRRENRDDGRVSRCLVRRLYAGRGGRRVGGVR
jgi:penicillin-binding protein 1B